MAPLCPEHWLFSRKEHNSFIQGLQAGWAGPGRAGREGETGRKSLLADPGRNVTQVCRAILLKQKSGCMALLTLCISSAKLGAQGLRGQQICIC